MQVIRNMQTKDSVRSLAFDPDGVFVAAVCAGGGLEIFEADTGKPACPRKVVAPKVSHAHIRFMSTTHKLCKLHSFNSPASALALAGSAKLHGGSETCTVASPNG